MNQIAPVEPRLSVTESMAQRFGMTAKNFEATLRATVVPPKTSPEQFAAFLLVAREYGLNPITKEIYAFPGRGGGIMPIVSIDGWMNLMNSHPQMDGLEFDDLFDEDGSLISVTARIWRKDRSKAIAVTEYMAECKQSTETWKKWPCRMLRHKAAIQCARYAFGFSGIYDPDEATRAGVDVGPMQDAGLPPPRSGPPPAPPRSAVEAVRGNDGDDWRGEVEIDHEERPKGQIIHVPHSQQAQGRQTRPGDTFDPGKWVKDIVARFDAADDPDQHHALSDEMDDKFDTWPLTGEQIDVVTAAQIRAEERIAGP